MHTYMHTYIHTTHTTRKPHTHTQRQGLMNGRLQCSPVHVPDEVQASSPPDLWGHTGVLTKILHNTEICPSILTEPCPSNKQTNIFIVKKVKIENLNISRAHSPVRVQSSGISMRGESSPPLARTSLGLGLLTIRGCSIS